VVETVVADLVAETAVADSAAEIAAVVLTEEAREATKS
jgi:hypothetical protein